jgi:hypothetical protein
MSDEIEPGLEDDTLAALAQAADEVIHPVRPDNLGQKTTRQDTDGRIVTDVPCKGCQYNLRGQLPVGTCPECGYPTEESLKSDQLRFADLGWLRSLNFGLTWIIIATLGGTVANLLFQMIAAIVVSSRPFRSNTSGGFVGLDPAIQVAIIMDFIFFSAPAIILCIGYWHFTKPEPHEEKASAPQTLTRWSVLTGNSILIGIRLYLLLTFILTMQMPDSIGVVVGLIAGSAIILFVGFPAMMVYLRSLARRLPSRKLMRHTSIVLWGFIACFAGLGLIILATLFVGNEGVVVLIASPMTLGVVVFSIWWLVLLFVYNGRLSKTIRNARRLRRASTLDPTQAHLAVSTSHDEADEEDSDDEA